MDHWLVEMLDRWTPQCIAVRLPDLGWLGAVDRHNNRTDSRFSRSRKTPDGATGSAFGGIGLKQNFVQGESGATDGLQLFIPKK